MLKYRLPRFVLPNKKRYLIDTPRLRVLDTLVLGYLSTLELHPISNLIGLTFFYWCGVSVEVSRAR